MTFSIHTAGGLAASHSVSRHAQRKWRLRDAWLHSRPPAGEYAKSPRTLPVTIITLGLFLFVINAALFWFVAQVVKGFSVDGFLAALVGSLLYSLVTLVVSWVLPGRRK